MARDDFKIDVKETLALRVGIRCSNPNCRQQTSGPQQDPAKSVNVGVAAHITAASAGGARYDKLLSKDDSRNAREYVDRVIAEIKRDLETERNQS